MRQLKELNREELLKVYEYNEGLQEKVFDDMTESADFWLGEYLDCWERGAVDYSLDISGCYNYFTVTDFGKFLTGLQKAQDSFCFLSDKWNPVIAKAWQLYEKYTYNAYDFSDLNYERIENRLTELIESLETACYSRVRDEYDYCFNEKNQMDYFLDFYIDTRTDDNFYINEDFELLEHIEYEKSYKK